MELTEHQNHLKSVTEQANGLVNEINQLECLKTLKGFIDSMFEKFKNEKRI